MSGAIINSKIDALNIRVDKIEKNNTNTPAISNENYVEKKLLDKELIELKKKNELLEKKLDDFSKLTNTNLQNLANNSDMIRSQMNKLKDKNIPKDTPKDTPKNTPKDTPKDTPKIPQK